MKSSTAPTATPVPWAVARLRLGQSNVGFWVLASLGILWAPPLLPEVPLTQSVLAWALAVGVFVLVQAPFDAIGGYLLPTTHGRRPPGVARWLRSWLPGVAIHATVLMGLGALALAVGSRFGDGAAIGVGVLGGLVLLGLQGVLVRLLSTGMSSPEGALLQGVNEAGLDPARVRVVETDDSGFVGGWVGLPGRATLLVPARWAALPSAELHASLVRRRLGVQSGSRLLGLVAATGFNAIGLAAVVAWLPGAGFQSFDALLTTSAGFTLWSFFGILTLPSVSRDAVTALDRATVAQLGSSTALARAITTLDRVQEDEGRRSPWTETIFHPVPARADRIDALQPAGPTGARPWRVTRLALFSGWAHFSWLSRAVHCNIGRPELWVLYPGD